MATYSVLIIPISKSKRKSINCYQNYRGIALSSILEKVFDHILFQNNYNVFDSSDFKKKHSTTQCAFQKLYSTSLITAVAVTHCCLMEGVLGGARHRY